jgi:putative 4-mercaptohistidine N1-methyltranferase
MSSRELVTSFAGGAIVAGSIYALIQQWRAAKKDSDVSSSTSANANVSTTSSSHGQEVYETDKAVAEYLMFHYAKPDELLPYAKGPFEAVDFAAKTAVLCAKWAETVGVLKSSSSSKLICTADGDDCPCHSRSTSRPPSTPKVLSSSKITLGPNEEKWMCNCGLSKNFPYCDGSHNSPTNTSGLKPSPLKNTTDASKDFYVCQCGHSGKFPLCDGTHKKVHSSVPGPAAFDIGCAVGRSTFELSALGFSKVVGLDFSHAFVNTSKKLQELPATSAGLPFTMQVEGEITQQCFAKMPSSAKPQNCTFIQGDACNLEIDKLLSLAGGNKFQLVHAANLLCRLPEPRKLLAVLPKLVSSGGLVVFFSPYSWLQQYTKREFWLGAKEVNGKEVRSKDALELAMKELGFKLLHGEDVPFLIREHVRKFQYGFAHMTVFQSS